MLTFTETALPATKSSSSNAVHFENGKLIVNQVRAIAEYVVTEFPVDNGRGFRLTKIDGGTDKTELVYSVFIPSIQAEASGDCWPECDCKGHARHGHCKHVEAVRAVLDRGMMPLPKPVEVKKVMICRTCKSRPTDGYGYQCEACECRM